MHGSLEAAKNDSADRSARKEDRIKDVKDMKEEIPVRWRKYSATLLQLGRDEATMLYAHQFQEAARINAHADDGLRNEKEVIKLFWAGQSAKLIARAEKEGALAHLTIGHLHESLRGAEKVMELTCDLKKQNESRHE